MNITVERIQALVESSGVTVRELAENAGCSKSAMQRYIAGERDIPTNIVSGIASAFNVHPAYLFGWVDDPHYSPDKTKQPTESELSETKSETKLALHDLVDSLSESEAAVLLASLKSGLGR